MQHFKRRIVHSLLNILSNIANLTVWASIVHIVLVFESVHIRSLQIYEYFMVAIIGTIFIMIHCCGRRVCMCQQIRLSLG